MERQFCQSCSMPMDTDEVKGTNADGSKNQDYCTYCYQEGKFTKEDATMEEMIELCVPHMNEMSEAEARSMLQQFMPTLKRWKQ